MVESSVEPILNLPEVPMPVLLEGERAVRPRRGVLRLPKAVLTASNGGSLALAASPPRADYSVGGVDG
jgi:hypothetical protein